MIVEDRDSFTPAPALAAIGSLAPGVCDHRAHGAEMGYPIPDVVADGEVVEADPPRRLVQTWRMLMDPGMAAEGFTRLTWELEEGQGGVTKLTVTHELQDAPKVAALVAGEMEPEGAGGGWSYVLSDLKTLLETGKPLMA